MIYFIQKEHFGPIKIGYTNNLKKRLSALQVGNHCKLRILGTIRGDMLVEKHIHKHLKTYRIEGEWFKFVSFVKEYIISYPGYKSYCLQPKQQTRRISSSPKNNRLSNIERDFILQTLKNHNGNKLQTAITLEISRSTLYQKLKKYNLSLSDFSDLSKKT